LSHVNDHLSFLDSDMVIFPYLHCFVGLTLLQDVDDDDLDLFGDETEEDKAAAAERAAAKPAKKKESKFCLCLCCAKLVALITYLVWLILSLSGLY
jgi:hypothetical protein